jgi:hypothetical protein
MNVNMDVGTCSIGWFPPTLGKLGCFDLKFSTVVVGGIELSGMSTIVVKPPAAAADVAVRNPSHSVRPKVYMPIGGMRARSEDIQRPS